MPLLQDSHTPTRFLCAGEMERQSRSEKTPGIYINSCLKAEGGEADALPTDESHLHSF